MAFLVLLALLLAATADSLTFKPSCQASCGGVDIPYPYGIGEGCFLPGFEITCLDNAKPVLGDGNIPEDLDAIQVLNISVMPRPEAQVLLPVSYQCFNPTGDSSREYSGGFTLNSAHRISNTRNELYVLGCNTFAYTGSGSLLNSSYTGCMAYCDVFKSMQDGACAGIGCCRVEIPPGMTGNSGMTFSNWSHLVLLDFNPCDSAFIVEKANYTFQTADLQKDPRGIDMPVVLDWAIRDRRHQRQLHREQLLLRPGAQQAVLRLRQRPQRVRRLLQRPRICLQRCTTGYEGNPYLQNGCTRMASSGSDEMPKEKFSADLPNGVDVPLCWCQDPCRLMVSREMSYTYGRRFFMCANYDEEPATLAARTQRRKSPPTICDYIQWLDNTQSKEDEEALMHECYSRRDYTLQSLHEWEEEEKRKRWQEEQRKEKMEAERRAAEARAAERARKRETARRAKEEGEEAHARRMRKGKYPRCPE